MMSTSYTSQQIEAIKYSGNLVIAACPGSGKTTVVKEKVRNITLTLKDHQGVIAISFTKKASFELKRKCKAEGHNTKQSFFGTIDKFCLEEIIFPFLSQLWKGRPRESTIIDKLNNKQKGFFREVYKYPTVNDIILDNGFKLLYKQGYLWIEALPALALYILNKSESAVRYIKAKFTHIFLDEYQDTSKAQHHLFMKLVELGLIGTAVGDVNQSIYNFRGSSSDYLRELLSSKFFKKIYVDTNHRCHISINNYASRLLDPYFSIEDHQEECRVYRLKLTGDYSEISKDISEMALLHK
ncbi:UvrD-helicase domain-containing protein [Acinetobacter sp. HR7]|uniref:UvrD-helicase domain-containing protein n=1 Tax=Acinetobacter sp. HR7 TaxID=1509403 RepID=UPI0005368BDB|nr:UvrD-helicase domain-containing protein [Acinetobacter sp. HR7]KGT47801.1 hypothetical protein GW12_11600 [Acinetobacter sp. HR7]